MVEEAGKRCLEGETKAYLLLGSCLSGACGICVAGVGDDRIYTVRCN